MSALLAIGDLDRRLATSPGTDTNELQQLALGEKDHDERKRQTEDAFEEDLEEEVEEKTELVSSYILSAFERAKSARTAAGVDCEITEGRRLMRGEYTCEERARLTNSDDGIDTWFHLTLALKTVAIGFLRSVLVSDDDNPLWELKPTRIPNLPEEVVNREAELLTLELEQTILGTQPVLDELGNEIPPFNSEHIDELIDEWRETLIQKVDEAANRNTRNLSRSVADHFATSDFDQVLDNFLEDLVCDPTACIYGPVLSTKKIPEWRRGRKVFVERQFMEYRTVDIDRIWPSEDSKDAQTGTWMFFLDEHNKNYWNRAKRLKGGFVTENIDLMLMEAETGCMTSENPIEAEMERLEDRPPQPWHDDENRDVLKAHGWLPGTLLIKAGIEKYCRRNIDPLDCYEYEVWLVDRHIVRMVEKVFEGARPFFCASMYPKCGSFWGWGIPHVVKDTQRKANAYDRAEVRDVGYSSGPIFETDIGQLAKGEQIPDQIVPGMNLKRNSKLNSNGRLLEHTSIASQAQYFNQLKQFAFSEAEQITGINRQLLGQAQPGVSTLGESQLLQQNAATGLRSILANIDKNVLEPLVEMTACMIMMTTDDPSLKADAEVQANGSTGLLTRELNKNNLLSLFNTLLPLYLQGQPGVIEPEGMSCLLREIIRLFGQNPDKFVVDPLSARARNDELQAAIAQQGGGVGGGVPGGPNQAPAVQAPGAGITPASIGNAAIA